MADNSMVQLTVWDLPNTSVHTQYGFIHWMTYLKREKERIEKTPGRVVEIRHGKSGQCSSKYALFVNDIGAHIIHGRYFQKRDGSYAGAL